MTRFIHFHKHPSLGVKGKVVRVHVTRANCGSKRTLPSIPNLSTSWKSVVLASTRSSVLSLRSQLCSLYSETTDLTVTGTTLVTGPSPIKISLINGAVNIEFVVEKSGTATDFSCTSAFPCQSSFADTSYPGRRGWIPGPAVLQTVSHNCMNKGSD